MLWFTTPGNPGDILPMVKAVRVQLSRENGIICQRSQELGSQEPEARLRRMCIHATWLQSTLHNPPRFYEGNLKPLTVGELSCGSSRLVTSFRVDILHGLYRTSVFVDRVYQLHPAQV